MEKPTNTPCKHPFTARIAFAPSVEEVDRVRSTKGERKACIHATDVFALYSNPLLMMCKKVHPQRACCYHAHKSQQTFRKGQKETRWQPVRHQTVQWRYTFRHFGSVAELANVLSFCYMVQQDQRARIKKQPAFLVLCSTVSCDLVKNCLPDILDLIAFPIPLQPVSVRTLHSASTIKRNRVSHPADTFPLFRARWCFSASDFDAAEHQF